jgi:hypothetical protein
MFCVPEVVVRREGVVVQLRVIAGEVLGGGEARVKAWRRLVLAQIALALGVERAGGPLQRAARFDCRRNSCAKLVILLPIT